MSLYKRQESRYWWVKVTVGGETVRRSSATTSKSEARLFEERLRRDLWAIKKLGTVAYTWDLAAAKWLDEAATKRSLSSDEGILAWFQPHLTGRRLIEIDRTLIDELRAIKAASTSPATVNRHFALLRSILRRARDEWEWLTQIPAVPMYSLEDPEPVWISREKFEELAAALPGPAWERPARFAVATGLRRTPIATLTWPNVDMRRRHAWISALRSKNKKAMPLPLGPEAMRILRTVQGNHELYVFTYDGGPMPLQNGYYWKRWRKAVEAVGLKGFRFHDLRHTWASWHIQHGTPPHILRELGTWSDDKMTRRYAHLSAGNLAEWAHNIGHSQKRRSRK